MSMVRRNIFDVIEDELNAFFGDIEAQNKERVYPIALDFIEENDKYVVLADVPGYDPDDIEIEVNFDNLTIKAEHKEEKEEKDTKFLRRERFAVKMSRKIHFAKPVNPKNAVTTLKNGVLTIEIPFAEEAKTIKLIPKSEE